jgi:hypothetical protein
MKPIELDDFQGHIILYCKSHYNFPKTEKGFFEGLKMIWAIRCGYDYELTGQDTLTYIANDMYRIIEKCLPTKIPYIMETMHRELVWNIGKPENLTPIEAIIWEYHSHISQMQIKEKSEGKKRYQWIVKLPKPKKRIFNRILNGNGRYSDYDLITKKDKKVLELSE